MSEEKAALRAAAKKRIQNLDAAYTKKASESIAKALTELPVWKKAKNVFCFVGREDEIDTSPILQAAFSEGKTLSVPLCTEKGVMQARIIQSTAQLHKGAYGIREPEKNAPEQTPETMDLCIIPCLAASPDGARLGYGGGYYDRFLIRAPQAFRLVLCREKLLMSSVACEEHDCMADAVLTEENLFFQSDGSKKE